MIGLVRLTRAGQVLDGVECARIVVQAPGVTVKNCRVIGDDTSTNHGLIDFTHPSASGTIIKTHVEPLRPTLWQTGVLGHDFRAQGVVVRHTVDGFGVYDTHRRSDPVDVLIQDCDVDELVYFVNDPNHSDKHTHNDAVQVQGGKNIIVRDSRLHALVAEGLGDWRRNPYRPAATGQAIGVTPNVSKVSWLHVEGCDLDGGAQPVTLIPGKFGRVHVGAFVNNTFGRHGHSRRAGAAHPDVTADWKGNRWSDGKEAKLVRTRSL